MQLDPTTLLTGGIFAAIAGFWSQFRNALQQLSSLIVVQSRLDANVNYYVRTYLKRHYKVVPSGLRYYCVRSHKVVGLSRWVQIPFRLHQKSMIFYTKWEVVIYDGHKVSGLRGLCNLDRLVSVALDEGVAIESKLNSDRFAVIFVMGREKGMWAAKMNSNQTESKLASGKESSTTPVDDYYVDKEDTSFKYPKEYYTSDQTVDPFKHLYYNEDVLVQVENAKRWLSMGDWYAERSIPWRRGWMLHGPGGTGKSSLARAMAELFRIPIYDFKLNTLSDQEFIEEWGQINAPCIVLFEDFDNVFDGRTALTEHRSLSFDTILNTLSGVNSFSGVFLIVTTNHLDKVDPAMGVASGLDGGISTRPGRIDTVIHLGEISRINQRKMASHILRDWPDLIEEVLSVNESMTPVQFQERCLAAAFGRISS